MQKNYSNKKIAKRQEKFSQALEAIGDISVFEK
jgi:hypothetical protein